MATNLPDNIFKCISLNEKFCILTQITPKFVPMGPIENRPALVQVMALCQTGDKPLPELMLTRFTDAYMWHKWERVYNHPGLSHLHIWILASQNLKSDWELNNRRGFSNFKIWNNFIWEFSISSVFIPLKVIFLHTEKWVLQIIVNFFSLWYIMSKKWHHSSWTWGLEKIRPIICVALQWCHIVVIVSQITNDLTVFSTVCSANNNGNIKHLHYSFVRETLTPPGTSGFPSQHLPLWDSPHKGPIIWKTMSWCHYECMIYAGICGTCWTSACGQPIPLINVAHL